MNAAILTTPIGALAVITDADGTVVAAGWEPLGDLAARVLPDVDPSTLAHVDELHGIADRVRDYFAGDVSALDDVPVRQVGGPFTQRAWESLRAVPPGVRATYTQLAAMSGNAAAVRAAGSACATNGVAPFIPCHRIVRRDGGLGGYRFGLAVKRWLLDHERTAVDGTGPR